MKQYYILTQQELLSLLSDSICLNALEHGGVDNWDWYIDSIRDFIDSWIKENNLDPTQYWKIEDVAKKDLSNYPTFILEE